MTVRDSLRERQTDRQIQTDTSRRKLVIIFSIIVSLYVCLLVKDWRETQ